MREKLEIYTFGNLRIRVGDTAVTNFASRKAEALLVYLACNPRSHARETLAAMFWDDSPQQRALANLSVLLSSLRKTLGKFLATSRYEISLTHVEDLWVDALDLSKTLDQLPTHKPMTRTSAAAATRVLNLVHGPFLSGFFIQQAGPFSEWVLLEQERLAQLTISGMDRLIDFYMQREQPLEGISLGLRLVSFDPLREESHRKLMRLYALSGQRNAAIEQYQMCTAVLADELGVEPTDETRLLMAQIRDGEFDAPASRNSLANSALAMTSPRYPHNLPTDMTTFVGRDAELAQIEERLNQPVCRMLTVVGPGGVGKTRLIQAAARQRIDQYLHGITFVPLASLASADLLETALAEAVKFTFSGRDDTSAQLLNYLSNKEMLIVLDSFEHLSGDAAVSLLTAILADAPEVQLLLSSRERLHVQAEWLFEVRGLSCPPQDAQENLEQYGAVQLFLQRARQVSPTFDNGPAALREVANITRLLEGMPLGIELAASNVRYHSCADIAAGIREGLDFLRTSLRDLPQRHRSVRAVIDHSWDSLTPQEQEAFMSLSVFRGVFSQEAARKLLSGHASQLYALVDKSLLQRQENGRYHLHNLLRHYAAERMRDHSDSALQAYRRHVVYYAELLQRWQHAIKGGDQTRALEAIQNDIENIRAAWQYAKMLDANDTALFSLLSDAVETLFHYYSMGSWFSEGKLAFKQGADWLTNIDGERAQKLHAKLLARYGWFAFLLGDKAAGRAALSTSLSLNKRLNEPGEVLFCYNYLGAINFYSHEFEDARAHLEQGIEIARAIGDTYGEAIGLNILGVLHFDLHKIEEAETYLRDSLRLKREIGDRWGIAFSLEKLGTLEMMYDHLKEAEAHFEESLAIRRNLGDRRGVALCLYQLAELARKGGDETEARSHYRDSLALFETIGDVQAIDAVQKKLNDLG